MTMRLFIGFLLLCTMLLSCIDPVEPEFQFEEDFYLIEGQIVSTEEASIVRISRSGIIFNTLSLVAVDGAVVSSVSSDGSEVNWAQMETGLSAYVPPANFAAVVGNSYFIRVVLPNGQLVESTPEIVPALIPIEETELRFEQESYFSDARARFIPAFQVLVSLNDPADQDNYYQWRFQYWEDIDICITCERSALRGGICTQTPNSRFQNFDYQCEVPCWVTKEGASINILSDEFTQGQQISGVEAGSIDFLRRGGLLVSVEQYNITKEAFDYSSVLKDLATGSGGLNATLPAALLGNLSTISGGEGEAILGYIRASSLDQTRIYLDRDTFDGQPIPFNANPNFEPGLLPGPPLYPCDGRDRTDVKPTGWPD